MYVTNTRSQYLGDQDKVTKLGHEEKISNSKDNETRSQRQWLKLGHGKKDTESQGHIN